jgi:hypothetical protein
MSETCPHLGPATGWRAPDAVGLCKKGKCLVSRGFCTACKGDPDLLVGDYVPRHRTSRDVCPYCEQFFPRWEIKKDRKHYCPRCYYTMPTVVRSFRVRHWSLEKRLRFRGLATKCGALWGYWTYNHAGKNGNRWNLILLETLTKFIKKIDDRV